MSLLLALPQARHGNSLGLAFSAFEMELNHLFRVSGLCSSCCSVAVAALTCRVCSLFSLSCRLRRISCYVPSSMRSRRRIPLASNAGTRWTRRLKVRPGMPWLVKLRNQCALQETCCAMGVFLSFMIHFLVHSLLSECLSSLILHSGMHTGSKCFQSALQASGSAVFLPGLHLQIYHCLL